LQKRDAEENAAAIKQLQQQLSQIKQQIAKHESSSTTQSISTSSNAGSAYSVKLSGKSTGFAAKTADHT